MRALPWQRARLGKWPIGKQGKEKLAVPKGCGAVSTISGELRHGFAHFSFLDVVFRSPCSGLMQEQDLIITPKDAGVMGTVGY